jgi:DNA polymerase-3 subunit beta
MKFTCDRSILLKEIAIANEIIPSRNTISILSNIYLEARNGVLLIKATDMKVNFETSVPVDIKEDGSVTVYGDKFFGILNTIPDGDLEFEQNDSYFVIKNTAKKASSKLKSVSSDKFPEFIASAKDFFEIPIKEFKDMIQETIFAVSDDETRYFLNGVYFEKNEDKLIMVATDGRRLAHITKAAPDVNDFAGIIVPPKILTIIMKRAGDEGMAALSVTDKSIFVQFGSYKLSSTLIEGQFPNYRRVIPESQSFSFTVNRMEMLDALRGVSVMVEQKSHRVYLGLSSGVVALYCEENELGDSRREIPCKYEGEDVAIALNYRYIEEPFKVIGGEEITIHFTEPNKAITITPTPGKDFFHIIMPMQLD